ncbi:MAG: hypothetical protein A3C43_03875 [Candidatus Schekmanbacteria bacterium RIFCSPHIGHO2_02_FULL_38_11]|uniref:Glycosyltransferase RgtA/B/C/D-like domain-containing protein n=1 Tax=Candidatus Schekmanbacteria bacterium RIFCSPLOWO2_12_FULL_38_15 TaxID=1817883 RepID=A0A1F7SFI3_9BACT|nr:MAG: hypothetical protein A2043_11070 [Candidatus Schekmanbacteria bacterium GWA2_38_9]OGL49898.1 MAG: hypothetical protein A3H37_09835 [Candidatus Schekmanbacteria bacterium RIFCSPLOWO2_02_FULL_38_14]OGL51682.1 MAG: hypothetical protein A3C43_03875 [Candidatus Schekmanbacteria bacterium RIFCSPHIGHO2_02_FULL_38_11]OGL51937.1 MAG: hypothetical protein A3G31_09780 [Candidatus Schekmanbacteria bacterium RIFCSPLOWO2_12_FULL_38_15]
MKQDLKVNINYQIFSLVVAVVALIIFIKISFLPIDSFLLRRTNEVIFLTGIFFISVFLSTILRYQLRKATRFLMEISYLKYICMIGFLVFLISSFFSVFVLQGIPHIQDETVYLFQAKVFAMGKLYAIPNKLGEFFDYEFIINEGGKWYGKYFFGFPLLLSLGVILGYPLIINPLIGGISIIFISLFGREFLGKETERFLPLLCLLSPFYLFMCATHLSHPSALLFSSIFIIYFLESIKKHSWKYSFLSGAALGFNFNIRPYDSVLIAAPFFIYGIYHLMKKEIKLKQVVFFIASFLFFFMLFLLYNFTLTGDAFQTPFNKYCPTDRLGFGKEIGLPYLKEYGHTFWDGLDNTRKNLKLISEGLLGWPILTFFLIIVPFLFKSKNKWDWISLSSFSAVVFGYIFYYFDGIAFGARYYFITLPMLLVLTIRGITFIDEPIKKLTQKYFKLSPFSAENVLPIIIFFLISRNIIFYIPERIAEYGNRYWNIDKVLEQEVKKSSIHNAVIFIKSGNFRKGEAAPNYYGAGFMLNSPQLDTDIIYARDLGDEKNEKLMREFSKRKYFRFIYGKSLITSERNYIVNLSPVIYELPKPEIGSKNLFEYFP